MNDFNPNDVCPPNGQFFGFPFSIEKAPLVLYSVPWDVTASYRAGTSNGPLSILNASYQLDFYDPEIERAWDLGIATFPMEGSEDIKRSNQQLRPIAEKIIQALAEPQSEVEIDAEEVEIAQIGLSAPPVISLEEDLLMINEAGRLLNDTVYNQTRQWILQGKKIGLVGGDHSCPLGYMQALSEKYPSFGILHIDAHADLRIAYEGFEFSHASIMYNALKISQVSHLVQVGIRDYCEQEASYAQNHPKITQFTDAILFDNEFNGQTWHRQCQEIINALPQQVYISFDIDGLEPSLCPNTGTPVPGGLSYNKAQYLLRALWKSKKEIIGFDLCEVGEDALSEWDGNVGARILYLLSCISLAKP